MSCSTTTTTTCHGNLIDDLGCPIELDGCCVYYTGPNLVPISVMSGDSISDILEKLSSLNYHPSVFSANSNNSIVATVGGQNGHSPLYEVRINPSLVNVIRKSVAGLYVANNLSSDGKVSIDGTDPRDWLINKFSASTDSNHILTVWPVNVNGQIQIQPTMNMSNLLDTIGTFFHDQWCLLTGKCLPSRLRVNTTSTSSTTTGSTQSTSSSTTTTTTQGPTTSTSTTTSHSTTTTTSGTTTSTSSTTTTTTAHTFNTILSFISSAQANAFGVTATIGTTDSTTRFKFDFISPRTGIGANMDINIGVNLFMVVSFPSDYLGAPFQMIDSSGGVHNGVFTNGTVNF